MKWCEQRDVEFLKCMTITIIKSCSLTRTNVFVDFKIANTYNRKALDLFLNLPEKSREGKHHHGWKLHGPILKFYRLQLFIFEIDLKKCLRNEMPE